jgi:hypothetical protein
VVHAAAARQGARQLLRRSGHHRQSEPGPNSAHHSRSSLRRRAVRHLPDAAVAHYVEDVACVSRQKLLMSKCSVKHRGASLLLAVVFLITVPAGHAQADVAVRGAQKAREFVGWPAVPFSPSDWHLPHAPPPPR